MKNCEQDDYCSVLIDELIKNGPGIRKSDEEKLSGCLYHSVKYENLDTLRKIIKFNHSSSKQLYYYINDAILHEKLEVLKIFSKADVSDLKYIKNANDKYCGNVLYNNALSTGNIKIVELIIKMLDIYITSEHVKVSNITSELMHYLLANGYTGIKFEDIYDSAYSGNLPILKILLKERSIGVYELKEILTAIRHRKSAEPTFFYILSLLSKEELKNVKDIIPKKIYDQEMKAVQSLIDIKNESAAMIECAPNLLPKGKTPIKGYNYQKGLDMIDKLNQDYLDEYDDDYI